MRLVHPKDLKIGDQVKYVDYQSWINDKCHDDYYYGIIGEIYTVFKMERTAISAGHISNLEGANNPICKTQSGKQLSCWYGSWELVNRVIEPKVCGLVKWIAKYDKKI